MTSKKFTVSGLAIKPGISRNKINYTLSELQKFAPTLNGVSIQLDHSPSVKDSVGLVVNTSCNPSTGEVLYNGWVTGDELIEKIEDGRISKCSIGAICGRLVKDEENSDVMTAEDITGVELSLVVVPGIVGATVKHSLDSIEKNQVDSRIKILPVAEGFDFSTEEVELTQEELSLINKELLQNESVTMNNSITENKEIKGEEKMEVEEAKKVDIKEPEDDELKKKKDAEAKAKEEEEAAKKPMMDDHEEPDADDEEAKKKKEAKKKEAKKKEEESLKLDIDAIASAVAEKLNSVTKLTEEKKMEVKEEAKVEFKSKDEKTAVVTEEKADYCIEKLSNGKVAMFVLPDRKGNYK